MGPYAPFTVKRSSQFAMIYKIGSFIKVASALIFVDCKLNVNRKMSNSFLNCLPSQSAFSLVSMSQGVNRAVSKTFSGNNLCNFL